VMVTVEPGYNVTSFTASDTSWYSRITYTKSPSLCMTTFSASLTNLTALLPKSHDCSCYVSRRIRASSPLWLQKHTDLRAHDFAHSADFWHQPRLANVTCAWSWRLYGINSAMPINSLLLTTKFYYSLKTTVVYNDTKYSVRFMTL
jgi:hypothetical protein